MTKEQIIAELEAMAKRYEYDLRISKNNLEASKKNLNSILEAAFQVDCERCEQISSDLQQLITKIKQQ